MSVILRENEWAETALRECSLGKKPSQTLRRVARYYIDKGYDKGEVVSGLEEFIIKCDPSMSIPKWSNAIDFAVGRASKYDAINIDFIEVTDTELKTIEGLRGRQIKRLAFTLLCLAKYWGIVYGGDELWVNNKDSEIMAMANINTSIRRQGLLYGTLRDLGLIGFSKKVDNTSVKVCFVEDGDVDMRVYDFRSLGHQYLKHIGEPYFECENCGITTKIDNPGKGRRQKYCKGCAVAVQTQQRVNSVMRRRGDGKKGGG